jgi:hypothetical protein
MIDAIANSTFGIWAVAALIAFLDSAALLNPGEFTFSLRADGEPKTRIPRSPFLLRNRELIFVLASYFLRSFHLSSISSPTMEQERELAYLGRAEAMFRALGFVAAAALILILVVGPIISVVYGPSFGFVCVTPLVYANSLVGLGMVFRNRTTFEMSNGDFARLVLELAVCPVLAINIVKRLTMRRTVVFDTWALIGDDSASRDLISSTLEQYGAAITAASRTAK